MREAGAHSLKGKRKYGSVAKNPRGALTPDSLANNGVAYPKTFDLSADQAPIPASLPLPADSPLIDIAALPTGFGSLSPFADVVPAPGPASFTGNSIVPGGTGGGGGGGVPPLGVGTPTPSPTPTPTPPPPPPIPTPTPTPSPIPEPSQWMMLITAFALMGAEMRRRNRSEAPV